MPEETDANDVMKTLDLHRMTTAQLVKPPSAAKRKRSSKKSWEALKRHEGAQASQEDPDARRRAGKRGRKATPAAAFSRMPTPEQQAAGEYMRIDGARIDPRNKGEVLLVNLANRASGAGTMFNRGQITARELGAAIRMCELAERAQLSQLSSMRLGERVDGGKVDTDGSRLTSAAAAFGVYRAKLEMLSSCGRILVENCVVLGVAMEEAVRMRTVANRLGGSRSPKWRAQQAMILLRDALDHLADAFHLPEG